MKRYPILVAAIMLVLCAAWLVVDRGPPMRAEQDPKKPIEIPLTSIYSTNGQKGLKILDQGGSQ